MEPGSHPLDEEFSVAPWGRQKIKEQPKQCEIHCETLLWNSYRIMLGYTLGTFPGFRPKPFRVSEELRRLKAPGSQAPWATAGGQMLCI